MPYQKTAAFGGNGGSPFSDDLTQVCRLVGVVVRHGARVDAITSIWRTTDGSILRGPTHGGGGGSESSFELAEGEFITRIEGRSGSEVDNLKFVTNHGNVHGPYGGDGGDAFALSDVHVDGVYGRSGTRLDQVGFFTTSVCD